MSGKHDLTYTQNRELSWLRFNQRVLEEGADAHVPLMERLRFISIFCSNLDEFFMVRVGSLFDLSIVAPDIVDNKSGKTPRQQLDAIFEAVSPLIHYRDQVYNQVVEELRNHNVRILRYCDLTESERHSVDGYYKENVRPLLAPQIIDPSHPFPHLKTKELYGAALLRSGDKQLLGMVGVPDSIPKILPIPNFPGAFLPIEELIWGHLKKLFKIYTLEEHAIISVTRNADISFDEDKFDDDPEHDMRDHMAKLLKQRDKLAPVRLEVQGRAPKLTRLLAHTLKLDEPQIFTCSAPLKMGWAFGLPCDPELCYEPYTPRYPAYLTTEMPMWKQIQQRDVLLFYPYHTMKPFLHLLKESASDPNVLSIKITIYRLASNSAIVKYLCQAAENGKEVTVLMELRARFDEQNNIGWTEVLEEAGCRIIYGPEGYKCHSKLCLITRRDRDKISHITQIGTGNYNEKTSKLYTDYSIMTMDKQISEDAVAFFQNMLIGDLNGEYKHLLVAPVTMRPTIVKLIEGEIAKGEKGRIIIKTNSLTERGLIDKLSEASCAGVKIDLIVRGICCIVPGIEGKTENITVTSVVGRFLEHSRIYSFGTGEEQKNYISSADIMTRNQIHRVEVACPVRSGELVAWFAKFLDLLLSDNVKARRLRPDGSYSRIPLRGKHPISIQSYFLDSPVVLSHTKVVKKSRVKEFFSHFKKK